MRQYPLFEPDILIGNARELRAVQFLEESGIRCHQWQQLINDIQTYAFLKKIKNIVIINPKMAVCKCWIGKWIDC
ncbi:hypothetical protein GCM10007415_12240 [Parapedobacter pyrenivorans]|uniref:Uncharacterized protein n=1 Tax=Parapedobacter pyrenivorans TaxID=1305674 RepID=A0A917HJR1_9SPHI|nr:hypothetical protein GCM10007415_12240 [Parapedobacter pyrenivorans]